MPSDGDGAYRVAVYARVSTEEQAAEGYSLDAQKQLLLDYCICQGWDVAAVYEDDGFSGRTDKRPAYQRMMAEMGSWDVLLVVKMDRIHRNSRNFMAMMDLLERRGKKFVSSSESLDTTNALGRFVVDMIQRLAQLESEQIGERTHMGMREKAETIDPDGAGKRTMGFTPPYGYSLERGELVEDPEELDVVRRMFSEYSEGSTAEQICYRLNMEGVTTRRGNAWNRRNLGNILHNPVYAGYMRWEELMIPHRAGTAVTPEEYNRVQEEMASRVRDPSRRGVRLVPCGQDRRSGSWPILFIFYPKVSTAGQAPDGCKL